MKVCKKVEEKGETSYNEVADELVKEFLSQNDDESNASGKAHAYDEKNIRRRVYDALNVLMAMDIISKEKKEIRWKGLPNNANHDLEMLQREKERCQNKIAQKREGLQELLIQQVCFRNLVKRNQRREKQQQQSPPDTVSSESNNAEEPRQHQQPRISTGKGKVRLPFIVVNTSSNAEIHCEMNADRTDVMFDFSMPFEINDDIEILKRLGLNKTSMKELSRYLPRDLLSYCEEQHLLDSILIPDGAAGAPSSSSEQHPCPHHPALGQQQHHPFQSTSSHHGGSNQY